MRKILSLLAVIMAFAMVPAMAHAQDEIQGTDFTASSSNLKLQFDEGTIVCDESILQFQKASASQAPVVGGSFRQSPTSMHCHIDGTGLIVVVQTNAATVGWFFHTGEQGPGELQGALGPIQFTLHFWSPDQTVKEAQCTFGQNGAITVEYEQEVTNPKLIAQGNFASDNCGDAHLHGSFTTSDGLFIH